MAEDSEEKMTYWQFNWVNDWRGGDWRMVWRCTIPLPHVTITRWQVLVAWFCVGVQWVRYVKD